MTVATEEPKAMAKKQARESKEAKAKTLKCSEATYSAVKRVAALRGMDMADYVDEVLGPIAEKDLKAEGRKLAGN